MIKILKLHSTPEIFTPIEFQDGINLILGEKVPEAEAKTRKDKKTNGVGKSMSIEFINFCLLTEADSSRVMKIPLDKLNEEVKIKLDLLINDQKVTIIRTKKEPDKPIIETEDSVTPFSNLSDALKFLSDLFYRNNENIDEEDRPSFRELIAPLIRNENSEFKDIVNCHDLRNRIPYADLARTHLYFFGINTGEIKEIKKVVKNIETKSSLFNFINKRLTDDGRKKINDVKAEFNALDREMEKSKELLDKFETEAISQSNQEELVKLDNEIEEIRTKQAAIRIELKRIESMPKMERIEISEMEIVYNKYKAGLGSLVSESFENALKLKQKIEKYQSNLIKGKTSLLRTELASNLKRLNILDGKKSAILKNLDNSGILKDFKNSFASYSKKKDDLGSVLSDLNHRDSLERDLQSLKLAKDNLFAELDTQIFELDLVIRSFNQTLTLIHEFIMGNAEVYFAINTKNTPKGKQIIDLNLRINDDGSHSVDRTKVFIYDIGLILNEYTQKRHPMFLVHDNIFDVDQDTLIQSLNFLAEQEERGANFQYILTLNRDKIENEEKKDQIKLDIPSHTRASFTRQNKFLKTSYQEVDLK